MFVSVQSYTLRGFPGPLVNNPARPCADNSEAFGAGLTLAKICSFASFTITARDSFGNPLTADQADWYVRLTNGPNIDYANVPDAFTYPGSTEWARNSRYIASYIAQGTGNWNFLSLLEGPQLAATYYDSPNLNASTASTAHLEEVSSRSLLWWLLESSLFSLLPCAPCVENIRHRVQRFRARVHQ